MMTTRKLQSAVVLAAGQGSRFWPYAVVRNKVAFPIANVPVVRRLVDDLAALGIMRVAVVVGTGEASVRHALRGSRVQIEYVQQPHALGTARAALAGMALLQEDCLIVAGDLVTARSNLAAMLTTWAEGDAPALAMVHRLTDEDPRDWLIAHVAHGRLEGVEGHSREGELRMAGVYALAADRTGFLQDNPGLMRHVPVGGMPPLEAELAESLQMMVDEGLPVGAVETVDFHVDLDKPWHILEANNRVIQAMTAADFASVIPASSTVHEGAEIGGRIVLGEGCKVGNRVTLRGDVWLGDGAEIINGAIIDGPAVIGANTIVRDYCHIGGNSTLGPRGVYGHGAEFSGVALAKVYCFHYCEIWGVAGEAADFGAATVCGNLRYDDGNTVWRIKGRPETVKRIANAAYFGDYCRTGVNAMLMPGKRVGVYSVLGAGVIGYDDLPDRTMVTLKQELVTRPWGPERYGW